ncbi:mandelate racemase/muconate lactonizing enzyme family protein [Curtobacterium albidum]|uniref:Mandelate racemase/muconate lactonizing enzyme family protein n=1 Tax=Curtobacterium citreum TaxID=2036 RepID=A0A850DPN3_9MICO|nr:mandelate racemase/muconate lactonizing enzyme family protein [Curtobacterium albidum]NUU27184.1 mandelate racemase/muconate lactonizing enzyme family protein [Curtobacterium albidum]
MKITGFRELITQHDWHRIVGDVNGVSVSSRTDVQVLIITTDVGLEGISVTNAGPLNTARVFPVIDGQDPRSVTALYDLMLASLFKTGHNGELFATVGAIDHALWDLKAKAANEPLWRLLGGRSTFVPGYASALEFGLSDEDVKSTYGQFAARGFCSAKLKGGRDAVDDIRRLKIVRDVMSKNSDQPALMFDANEAWHRSQAVRHIRRIEDAVELTWIEEPVRRWDAAGLADIRSRVGAGVASGENLTGLEQYRPLFDADALDVVQFNSGWGITHALRVAALAHSRDLPVSPVGFTNVIAHAITAMPNHLTTEIQDLGQPLGVHIDQHIDEGGYILGSAPGAGIEIDEAIIDGLTRTPGWRTTGGPHFRPARAGLRIVPDDHREEAHATRIGA